MNCDACNERYLTYENGSFFLTYVYPHNENEIPDVWRVCSVPCIKEILRLVNR